MPNISMYNFPRGLSYQFRLSFCCSICPHVDVGWRQWWWRWWYALLARTPGTLPYHQESYCTMPTGRHTHNWHSLDNDNPMRFSYNTCGHISNTKKAPWLKWNKFFTPVFCCSSNVVRSVHFFCWCFDFFSLAISIFSIFFYIVGFLFRVCICSPSWAYDT